MACFDGVVYLRPREHPPLQRSKWGISRLYLSFSRTRKRTYGIIWLMKSCALQERRIVVKPSVLSMCRAQSLVHEAVAVSL